MEKKQNWCRELIKDDYKVSEPEFIGSMPIRQDIEVLSADQPKQLKLGWVVYETIGTAVVNTRAMNALRDPFRLIAVQIKDFCYEHSNVKEMREFVCKMLVKHPEFAHRIKDAILKVCPQYKEMIEKIIILV